MAGAVAGRKFCQPCKRKETNNVAEFFCKECREYQCGECEKIHQIFPVMSNHIRMKTNDPQLKIYDMKGLDQCKEHQRLLEFICEEHYETLCGKCSIVSHRSCENVVEVEEMARKKEINFSDIQQELSYIEKNATGVEPYVEKAKDNFTTQSSDITTQIQNMQDEVNAVFENLKQNVASKIDIFRKNLFNDFDNMTKESGKCIEELNITNAEIQAVSQDGTGAQQLIVATHLKSQVSDLKKRSESIFGASREIVVKFDFKGSLKLPPDQDVEPGELTLRCGRATGKSGDNETQKKSKRSSVDETPWKREIVTKRGGRPPSNWGEGNEDEQ